MGCFNTTGFLSKAPILAGDRVVCFLAKVTHQPDCYGCTPYYPFSIISPIFLPVRGEYNDYGSIEDIDDTLIAATIKQIGGVEYAEEVFNAVSRCGQAPVEHELKRWHYEEDDEDKSSLSKEECEHLNVVLKFYDRKDVPTILFEHEDFYDKLTEENQFWVSWEDEENGIKDTNWDKFWKTNERLKELFDKYPDECADMPKSRFCKFRFYDSYGSVPFDYGYPHLKKCMKDGTEPNEEFLKEIENLKITPLMYSHETEFAFKLVDKIPFGYSLFDFYDACKEEIRRVHNMYWVLMDIPMYVGLSKTAGEQHYNYKTLKKFLKLAEKQVDTCYKKHGDDY